VLVSPHARSVLSAGTAVAFCAALALSPARGHAEAPSRAAAAPAGPPGTRPFLIGPDNFSVLERDSGPVNYCQTINDPVQAFIRCVYRPRLQTVTLFTELPSGLRRGVRLVRWRWRVLVLPREGNECAGGVHADSAANVYLTWKRGLRWYSLKFIWSTEGRVGQVCAGTRNPFVAQDSVVLRSGGPIGVWQDEEVDPERLFRKHFESGDMTAEVPDMAGMGIMSDGDQSTSISAADFAGSVLFK
jgi:hypothetical protein